MSLLPTYVRMYVIYSWMQNLNGSSFQALHFLPKELQKVLTATLLFLVSIISHFFLSLFCNHQLVKRFCLCSLSLGNHQSLSTIFHALH